MKARLTLRRSIVWSGGSLVSRTRTAGIVDRTAVIQWGNSSAGLNGSEPIAETAEEKCCESRITVRTSS